MFGETAALAISYLFFTASLVPNPPAPPRDYGQQVYVEQVRHTEPLPVDPPLVLKPTRQPIASYQLPPADLPHCDINGCTGTKR
jgi:hypothetical protein